MTREEKPEIRKMVREFGEKFGAIKIDGTYPYEMRALCSLSKAIEKFLKDFGK